MSHEADLLRLPPPSIASSAENVELVEYTDEQGRLLLVAPRLEAQRLGLYRKLVGVALHVGGGRIAIRRAAPRDGGAGLLDLTGTAWVRPGESREDAALRSLGAGPNGALFFQTSAVALGDPGPRLLVTLFQARGSLPGGTGELLLDRDELEGLAVHSPELLTPGLLWAVRGGYLWDGHQRNRHQRDGRQGRTGRPGSSSS